MGRHMKQPPILMYLARNPGDKALLDVKVLEELGESRLKAVSTIDWLLQNPRAALGFELSVYEVPVYFHVLEYHLDEGIYPAPKELVWHVRVQPGLDDGPPVLVAKTRSLKEAAEIFIEAEDHYEDYKTDHLTQWGPLRHMPPVEVLERLLKYDPETNRLTWRRRFPYNYETRKVLSFNQIYAGRTAFKTIRADGSVVGMLEGVFFDRYKVLWKLIHRKDFPEGASPAQREEYKEFVKRYREADESNGNLA